MDKQDKTRFRFNPDTGLPEVGKDGQWQEYRQEGVPTVPLYDHARRNGLTKKALGWIRRRFSR